MDHDPNYLKLLAVASELARCRDVVIACRSRVPLAVDRRGLGRVMYDLNAAIHDVTIAALRQEYTTVVCLRPPPSEQDAHRAWQPSSVEHWLDVPRLDLSPSDPLWTAQSRYDLLRSVAETLARIYRAIPSFASALPRIGDREILIGGCKTDLGWAAENCAVVADHQIGRSFNDDMWLNGIEELTYARPVDRTPVGRIDLGVLTAELPGLWVAVPSTQDLALQCLHEPVSLFVDCAPDRIPVDPELVRRLAERVLDMHTQRFEGQFTRSDFSLVQDLTRASKVELRVFGRSPLDGAQVALAVFAHRGHLACVTVTRETPQTTANEFLEYCSALFDRVSLRD